MQNVYSGSFWKGIQQVYFLLFCNSEPFFSWLRNNDPLWTSICYNLTSLILLITLLVTTVNNWVTERVSLFAWDRLTMFPFMWYFALSQSFFLPECCPKYVTNWVLFDFFFLILCSCVSCYTLLVMKAFFFKCRPNLLLQFIGLWNVNAFCVEWLFFFIARSFFKPQQFTRKGFCFSGSFPKLQILTEKAKSFSTCWLTPTGDFKPCRTDKSDRF